MRPALLLCWLAVSPGIARAQAPADSLASRQVVGAVGERLQALMRRFAGYGFNGAVLVAINDTVVLLDGYGFADREREIPNTPATLFEINSMTKMLTGAAILQLQERGLLRVADSVSRYLGPFPTLKAPVTVDHLATHMSGLATSSATLAGTVRAAFVQSMKDAPIDSRPGNRYRYTNAGFSLLAAIIEQVSGESYNDYVRGRIFAPAGLQSSTFRGDISPDDPKLARGYVGSPGGARVSIPPPYEWGTIGAGGWIATVGDVFRFVRALESGWIVSEESRRQLYVQRPNRREGYGWHVERTAWNTTLRQKGGGSDQFASQLLYFPDDRLVVVWASNDLRQLWRRALNLAIPAVALGREVPEIPPPIARARADLAPLTGGYGVEGGGVVYLRAGEDYLYARHNKAGLPEDAMFFPQNPTSFTGFDPAAFEVITLNFARLPTGTLTAQFRRARRVVNLQRLP